METLIRFIALLVLLIPNNYILAESISGHSAVLQVLDKITARISTVEIAIGEKKRYGSLIIEIFDCKKDLQKKFLKILF